MRPESSREREMLRRAFSPGGDCPPPEKLELCLETDAAPPGLAAHIGACARCRAELELLRSFHSPARDAAEADAIRQVAARMQRPVVPRPGAAPAPWWKAAFQARWLSPAALAMAAMLVVVAVGLEWRHGAEPRISGPVAGEQDVLRSGALAVTSPLGDIAGVPAEIRWTPVGGAAEYHVRLLEVDDTEVWSGTTRDSSIAIPAAVRARIVPSKTLLLQVAALDASGKKLVDSNTVRFRLLQNVYTR